MSRVEIGASRAGTPTASLDGRHLHSRFDPRREADRFLEGQHEQLHALVIVLAPGLGYLYDAIRARAPNARIIGCSLLPELAGASVSQPDALWIDGSGERLDGFLDRAMTDLDASSVTVLEWSPVADALSERARWLRDTVAAAISRSQASLLTQGASGRRWLRNTLHNFVHARAHGLVPNGRRIAGLAVIAAGPSLEESIETLRPYRDRIVVWATASALDSLMARDIVPDMIVATDAAVYATEHLRAALTTLGAVPVAAPLAATRGIAGAKSLVVLAEGDALEHHLLDWPDTKVPMHPPHGTVTATALALARATTSAPILLLGADFGWRSSRSHVRPHLSHRYRKSAATRLAPEETALYAATREHHASGQWHTDRTLTTYADWFNTTCGTRFAPVFSVHPSPFLGGLSAVGATELDRFKPSHPAPAIGELSWPHTDVRIDRVTRVLKTFHARVSSARRPDTPRLVVDVQPDVLYLGTRLALPTLLRWYRSGDRDSWNNLVERIVAELDELLEHYRVGP